MSQVAVDISRVSVDQLHEVLGLSQPCRLPAESKAKPLAQWRMGVDDAIILRYLYQQARPRRHLEFGTWQGAGALLCLQNCEATVWSVNLLEGEYTQNGDWAYFTDALLVAPEGEKQPRWTHKRTTGSGKTLYQTDALGFIGQWVHRHGLGYRLCQIYCDSRDWDVSAYPDDFFDTVLIDGGHDPEVVVSDTRKALSVLRPGGVMIWHDYCPDPAVLDACQSVRGVMAGIESVRSWLAQQCTSLFWVDPSWLLVGVKGKNT